MVRIFSCRTYPRYVVRGVRCVGLLSVFGHQEPMAWLDFTQNPGKVMDDITFVRSHWWLVSEGFSTIDRQLRCTETPRHSVPSYCRFPRLCRLKCVKSSLGCSCSRP